MGSVSTYIHQQIAVIVTTSGDVNRHRSSFKMATVLKEWTKEVRYVVRFFYGLFAARDQDCLPKDSGVLLCTTMLDLTVQ
jgi:hypothetical protein